MFKVVAFILFSTIIAMAVILYLLSYVFSLIGKTVKKETKKIKNNITKDE